MCMNARMGQKFGGNRYYPFIDNTVIAVPGLDTGSKSLDLTVPNSSGIRIASNKYNISCIGVQICTGIRIHGNDDHP